MIDRPLLSFIVLSYNYEKYIGQTIDSILQQTVQDFEIVVVDDASTDSSREVVTAYNDARIRLLVNEQNLGGAGSYNRAVLAARGEWLINLDADDWIAPEKSARQLDALARDARLDILGTHIVCVDVDGKRHRHGTMTETYTNHDLDLNRIDTWVGRNAICRSSAMVRRAAHLRIGLDDPGMIRAPDYELWTRALRLGCRFGIVPEPLTFYRLHARGVTFADPNGTFLELTYAMLRNLVPSAEAHAMWPTFTEITRWVAEQTELARLPPTERYRLLGALLTSPDVADFHAFKALLRDAELPGLFAAGQRCLSLLRANAFIDKLTSDSYAFMGARDWWHEQSDHWEAQAQEARERARQCEAATERALAEMALLRNSITERDMARRGVPSQLINAGRKIRWTAANVARAALSRCFRSL